MSKYAPHSRSHNNPRATSSTVCQKCLKTGQSPTILSCSTLIISAGHFIYECKAIRPYVSRPSRTQQLEKPGVLAKLKIDGKPSVDAPEEFKSKCVCHIVALALRLMILTIFVSRTGTADRILEAKEKERDKNKGKGKEKSRKKAKRCVVIPLSAHGSF
jgi:Zinc knuckle